MMMSSQTAVKHRMLRVCLAMGLGLLGAGSAWSAGPIFWDWPADRPFAEMQLEGAALDQQGNLVAGLAGTSAGPRGPEVFWRVIADGRGGYFTGTGHGGEIHHTDKGGQSRLVTTLEGTEVFSLMVLEGGDLLAGCGPEGQLYRIDTQGEATLLDSVSGGYVWSMCAEPGGRSVWLAAGSPAAVFRFDLDSATLEPVVELPAQNALDVAFDGQGHLLVATQGPGLVYRLDPGHPENLRLLFETPQDEARQFITGPEGKMFVLALDTEGSSPPQGGVPPSAGQPAPPPSLLSLMVEGNGPEIPRAALFRLEDDGLLLPWWTGDVDLMIAAWSEHWGWLGGGPLADEATGAVLYGLTPPAGSHPVAGWAGGDILDILVGAPGGKKESLIVGQAHPGGVTILGPRGEAPRHAVSPALDGGFPVRWGNLNWTVEGQGGSLKWSVRTGNRAEPDDSWTHWTDSWTEQGRAIPLKASRFLQWRVEFPDKDGTQPLRLTSVSVSAWQDNRPPAITSFTQEFLKDIHLGMMNNHNDNITQTFRSGLQAEFSRNSTADRRAGPDRAAVGRSVRVFTWDGFDPNGDRVVYDLEYRRDGDEAWRAILSGRGELLGSWDTSDVPDGPYRLRLTASDRLDNPEHLTEVSHREFGPVQVDNTGPEISGLKVQAVAGGFQLDFKAADEAGVLSAARLLLPDGQFERLDPIDGICDSPSEKFSTTITWPRAGRDMGPEPWRLRVEVWDIGGNTAVAEGEVR